MDKTTSPKEGEAYEAIQKTDKVGWIASSKSSILPRKDEDVDIKTFLSDGKSMRN